MSKEKKSKKPTKYELNVEPRFDEIRQWIKDGVIDDEIAVRLEIHITTLYEYVKIHPKFTKLMERPSKYETHIVPRFNEIRDWCQEGLTNEQMCEKLGIHPATWYEYANKHPTFNELINWSKSVTINRVETSLFKLAMGYEYEEIKTIIEEDKNGKKKTRIEKVKRHQPPNPTAMIFYLKNRAPNEWNDRREIIIDTKAAELERKLLFLEMIEADVIEAEYEAIEESGHIEEGFEEPDA
ncbi:transposase [Paenibacillus crassostreae]|uniref:Transposase n=1 Tax=Paenibacillus crassostreae TaxID=1763538 RepID=A0A167AUL8_9BACL|nr:transposase [Paenibacillus crassostreae]AOZ93621.1 transposase [Paenibacillus crassostreae]OAB71448.1 transposase [Paenibacillus crassostreae]